MAKKLVKASNVAKKATPAQRKNDGVKSIPRRGPSKSLRRAIRMLVDQGKYTVDTQPSDLFAVWDHDGPITDAVRSTASRLNSRMKEQLGLKRPRSEQPDSSPLKHVGDVDLVLLTAEYVAQFDGDFNRADQALRMVVGYLDKLGMPREIMERVTRGFSALEKVNSAVKGQFKHD